MQIKNSSFQNVMRNQFEGLFLAKLVLFNLDITLFKEQDVKSD